MSLTSLVVWEQAFPRGRSFRFLDRDRGHLAVPKALIAAGRGPSPDRPWRGAGAGFAVFNHSCRSPPSGRLVWGIVKVRVVQSLFPMTSIPYDYHLLGLTGEYSKQAFVSTPSSVSQRWLPLAGMFGRRTSLCLNEGVAPGELLMFGCPSGSFRLNQLRLTGPQVG